MSALPVRIKTMRYLKPPLIDFCYPVVEGLGDHAVEQKINQQIIGLMYRMIAELQQPDLSMRVSGSFESKTNQRNVLSLTLWALGDFGGAHPMTYIRSLNIDGMTGTDYPLGTNFKPGSNYVDILSDLIRKQIRERNIPLLEEFRGIRPDQDYYVADNVLIIYFQLYEISPYAAGFPYFPIPLYQIEDIIAENSLLQRMTGMI